MKSGSTCPQSKAASASVHLALFPNIAEIVPGNVGQIEPDWERLLRIRELVNVELEALRLNKTIGKGLDASVRIIAAEGSAEATVLDRYQAALPEFFNVSQATVQAVGATRNSAALLIEATPAEGAKCGRCWRVVPDVGTDARWPEVCARCAEALEAIGFPAFEPTPTGEAA